MFLWIHIISWLALIISTTLGLTRHSEKARNRYLIADRIAYLLLIITGVYLATKTLPTQPILTFLKGILGIASIGFVEIAFARQQESQLVRWLIWGLIGLLILTSATGFLLHYYLTGTWW